MRRKQLLRRRLGYTMRERKLELLRKELLHIRTLDIIRLLDFHHFQDLEKSSALALSICARGV